VSSGGYKLNFVCQKWEGVRDGMGIVREEDIQFWCTSKNLWKSGAEMEDGQQGECRKLIQTVVHTKTLS